MITQEVYDKAVRVVNLLNDICKSKSRNCTDCPFCVQNFCLVNHINPAGLTVDSLCTPTYSFLTIDDVYFIESFERIGLEIQCICIKTGLTEKVVYDKNDKTLTVYKSNSNNCPVFTKMNNMSISGDVLQDEIAKAKKEGENND